MSESEDDYRRVEEQIQRGFERELAACVSLESFAAESLDPWPGRPVRKKSSSEPPNADEILALLFARATKTYKASVLLARKGYGEQASMLNRSLFEGMAVAHWVAKNEAAAGDRFIRAWRFDRYLLAEVIEQTGWLEDDTELERPEIEEEELERMRQDFGRHGTRLWTGHRELRELILAIEADWGDEQERQLLRDFLRVVNRDNNQLLHSTVSGLAGAATRFEDGGMYYSVGPSTARVERGLFAAYWTYAQTLGVFVDRFELAVREELDAIIERQQYDFLRLSAEEARGVERNDPCPCGSGKKFKRCHEGRPLAGQQV